MAALAILPVPTRFVSTYAAAGGQRQDEKRSICLPCQDIIVGFKDWSVYLVQWRDDSVVGDRRDKGAPLPINALRLPTSQKL
jgi:hypothetical protein